MQSSLALAFLFAFFLRSGNTIRAPVREYAGLIPNRQAVLIDPHLATKKLLQPLLKTPENAGSKVTTASTPSSEEQEMPTPAALIDEPQTHKPLIRRKIFTNATDSHQRLLQQLQNRTPFWRNRFGSLGLGSTNLRTPIARLGGGGVSKPIRRKRPVASRRRTAAGILPSDITKENIVQFLRNSRNLTTTTTMQPTTDFLSRWHYSFSRGKPEDIIRNKGSHKRVPIDELINNRNAYSSQTTVTSTEPENKITSNNIKSRASGSERTKPSSSVLTGIPSVHDMTSTHFTNSSSTSQNERSATQMQSKNKLRSKLIIRTTTISPSSSDGVSLSTISTKKPHQSTLHDTEILESIKSIVKSASGGEDEIPFLKAFNSNTSPKPIDIFAGVEPLYGFKPSYAKTSDENNFPASSQHDLTSARTGGSNTNTSSKKTQHSVIEPNAVNAGPSIIVSPPPLGHDLAFKVGHSLPVISESPANQDTQELRTLNEDIDIVIGRPSALIQPPPVTVPTTIMPATLRNGEGLPLTSNTGENENKYHPNIGYSSSTWPPKDIGPLLDAIHKKYGPYNQDAYINSQINLKAMADSGEITEFFKKEHLMDYIKRDHSRFQPLSSVDRLGTADSLEASEKEDGSITGQFVALSGLALLMAFGGYFLYSSSEALAESRGASDPLLTAVNQARNGLKLLQQGLDEYETKLIENKQNLEKNGPMQESYGGGQPTQDISLDLDKIWGKIQEIPEKIADKLFFGEKSIFSKAATIVKKQLNDPDSIIGSMKNSLIASLTQSHPPSRGPHRQDGDDPSHSTGDLLSLANNFPVMSLLEHSSLPKQFVSDVISKFPLPLKPNEGDFENRAFGNEGKFWSDLFFSKIFAKQAGNETLQHNSDNQPKDEKKVDEETENISTPNDEQFEDQSQNNEGNVIEVKESALEPFDKESKNVTKHSNEKVKETGQSKLKDKKPSANGELSEDISMKNASKTKDSKLNSKQMMVKIIKSLFGNDSVIVNEVESSEKKLLDESDMLKEIDEETSSEEVEEYNHVKHTEEDDIVQIIHDRIDKVNITAQENSNDENIVHKDETKNSISNGTNTRDEIGKHQQVGQFDSDTRENKSSNIVSKEVIGSENSETPSSNDESSIQNGGSKMSVGMSHNNNDLQSDYESSNDSDNNAALRWESNLATNNKSIFTENNESGKENETVFILNDSEATANEMKKDETSQSSDIDSIYSNKTSLTIESSSVQKDDLQLNSSTNESIIVENDSEPNSLGNESSSVEGDDLNPESITKESETVMRNDSRDNSFKKEQSDVEENDLNPESLLKEYNIKVEDKLGSEPPRKESLAIKEENVGQEFKIKKENVTISKLKDDKYTKSNVTTNTEQKLSKVNSNISTRQNSESTTMVEIGEVNNEKMNVYNGTINEDILKVKSLQNESTTPTSIDNSSEYDTKDIPTKSHEKELRHKTNNSQIHESSSTTEANEMHDFTTNSTDDELISYDSDVKVKVESNPQNDKSLTNKQMQNHSDIMVTTAKPHKNESINEDTNSRKHGLQNTTEDLQTVNFSQTLSKANESKGKENRDKQEDDGSESNNRQQRPSNDETKFDEKKVLTEQRLHTEEIVGDVNDLLYNSNKTKEDAENQVQKQDESISKETRSEETQLKSDVPNIKSEAMSRTSSHKILNNPSQQYNVFLRNKDTSLLQEMVSRFIAQESIPDNLISV